MEAIRAISSSWLRISWLSVIAVSLVLLSPSFSDAVSLSTFDCDFENASCSLQWGSSGRPGVWSWTEQQGRTRSRGTGPEFDNTTRLVAGTYKYFEASYPRRQGDRGEMRSPLLPTVTESTCRLHFAYHMFGVGMGTLNVILTTVGTGNLPGAELGQVFSISGNRGNTWHSASVPLDSRGNPFFIIFQAVRGSRYSSDVAVDDVHFVGCTGQPATPSTTSPPGSNPKIRLVGGANAMSGRVEVFHAGEWGTVCDDDWEIRDANVVCRSLGFGMAESAQCCARSGRGSGRIWMDNLRCSGLESSLEDCIFNSWGVHDCGHGEDASVVCSGTIPTRPPTDPNAPKADLVFNGPEMLSSMNLYIEQLTAEQVVCSAEEACLSITPQELAATRNGARLPPRHLLRFTTAAWNRGNADFRPPPAEPQWHACHRHYHSFDDYATYDLVDERGNMRGFGHKASFCLTDSACDPGVQPKFECGLNNQGISMNCSDAYGANLDCQWVDMTGIAPGRYWLTVHINPGRVAPELSYDNNQATVAFTYTGRTINNKRLVSGPPQTLSSVPPTQPASSMPSTAPPTTVASTPDVRLVSRTNNSLSGRVEVRVNGVWGTVCDDRWDFNEGNVVCKQLGLGYATDVSCCARDGNGQGQIWLDELQCRGTEPSLLDCRHARVGFHDCSHSEDAGLTCSGAGSAPPTPPTTRIRLVGGSDRYRGRVEVFAQNQWGTVCDDHWTKQEAAVVCRQLGYGRALAAHCCGNHGAGTGSIWLDDIVCTGRETDLLQCTHPGLGQHNCAHDEDASVVCAPPSGGSSGGVGQGPNPTTAATTSAGTSATQSSTTAPVTTAASSSGDGVSTSTPVSATGATSGGCFQPGIPQNGGRNGTTAANDAYSVGAVVQYRCETGYTLVGIATRICQLSGQWSGALPRCDASPSG